MVGWFAVVSAIHQSSVHPQRLLLELLESEMYCSCFDVSCPQESVDSYFFAFGGVTIIGSCACDCFFLT